MSSGTALEKLFFSVALIDKVTAPSKGVSKALKDIQRTAHSGFMNVGKGALAIGSAAYALNSFVDPARGFNKALGEVASLDVSTDELERLGKAADQFTMQFGGDAADVVKSAYDIQSAIPGLAQGALAAFTYQGALLAKAGKSNSATITKYMGTMYNIFEEDAKRVGQADWVEQLTGKTGYAIKMFKTTGDEMSAAFTNLGATGQVNNVGMNEQMAILGTLQGTMGGANAGTAYKAFLNKIGQAQTTLGLQLTDASGKALPMVEILEKIKAQVGPGGLKTADSTRLLQAFGEEGGKAVMNLLGKVDQIKGATADIAGIKDSGGALKMAEAMTDPLERFNSTLNVVKKTLGQGMLPTVNFVLSALSRGLYGVNWLLEKLPWLKYVIGVLAITVTAASMALGVMWLVVGATNVWTAFTMKLAYVNKLLIANKVYTLHATAAQKAAAIANLVWSRTLGGAVLWTKLATAATWLFSAALWSNPVTWVVIGIIALIGVIVLLIYYWDDVSAAAGRCWNKIVSGILWCWEFLKTLVNIYLNFWPSIWAALWDGVSGVFDKIMNYWRLIAGFGKYIMQALIGWIIGRIEGVLGILTKLPFIGGKIQDGLNAVREFAGVEVNQTRVEQPVVSAVTESRRNDVAAGGVRSNVTTKNNNYGGVTFNVQNPMGPGQLEDWLMLQGG